MPKTNIAYGKSYKPCPCAQIHEYTTLDNTYYTATCCSPKREVRCKFTRNEQTRICMGGSHNGQRYTTCPYYVKDAKIIGPKRTKRNSWRNILLHLVGFILCLMLASSCANSGAEYSKTFTIVFLVLGVCCLVPLFVKDDKIDNSKRGRKR